MLQTEAEMRTYVDVQCSLMEKTFNVSFSRMDDFFLG